MTSYLSLWGILYAVMVRLRKIIIYFITTACADLIKIEQSAEKKLIKTPFPAC